MPPTPAPANISAIERVASVADALDQVASTVIDDTLGADAPPGTVTFEEVSSVHVPVVRTSEERSAPSVPSVSSTVLAPDASHVLQEQELLRELLGSAGSGANLVKYSDRPSVGFGDEFCAEFSPRIY